MPGVKQIMNPSQAYTAGASWGNQSLDNEMTQIVDHLQNNTGLVLYTGDIVCLDVSGIQAILATVANDPTVIGVVGGAEQWGDQVNPPSLAPAAGGYAPPTISAVVVANMGFTGASGTVTYAGAVASDLGKNLIPVFNASTNPTPQVYTITAVTVGTGYTVTPNFNGTTGTFSTTLQNAPTNIGPGYTPLAFNPQSNVPVVTAGYGRVNINGQTLTVAKDLVQVTSGSVVGTRIALGAQTAANTGSIIAAALEAYAARDTSLTTAGITGHDSVRALIGRF